MTANSQKKLIFDIFRRADIGTILAIITIALAFIIPEYSEAFAAILALYMLIFLSRKPKEEFGYVCWQAGCITTYRALLVALLIVPFLAGIFAGFFDGHQNEVSIIIAIPTKQAPYNIMAQSIIDKAPLFALFTFFLDFQRKRFTGV